ncbi:MAG: hypothetical protein P1U78_05775 [Alcanivoracaceae bacterium]|nr:hypothetical protein [Alcanivoracaceae bacterium]
MVRAFALSLVMLAAVPAGAAGLCGFPGGDGAVQAQGVVNLWLESASSSDIAPGSRWLPVAAHRGQGELGPGDLGLLVQMQGARIAASNDDAYGDGISGDAQGRGWLELEAGHFEFVRIEEVEAGRVRVRGAGPNSGVVHAYRSREPNSANESGRQRWQLIRVPQYESLTLTGDLAVLPWDGASGGILAVDVRRSLQLNGHRLSVAGAGFRGGAALPLVGALGDVTDYRYRAPAVAELAAAFGQHASKGEGLAGTPRWLATDATGTVALDTRGQADALAVSDGYPNGSMARGAPANAGGGASSLRPDNSEPAGGGGGAGGTAGKTGLNAAGQPFGGQGGAGLADLLLLSAGGGGGAGSRSFGTGLAGSGGAGGGIIVIRAGRLEGPGDFDLRGQSGRDSAEGAGGGGGGGTMLLQAAFTDQQERHWLLSGGKGGDGVAPGGAGGSGRLLSGGGALLPDIDASHFDQVRGEDLPGVAAGYLCRPAGMLLAGQIFEDNGAGAAQAHDGQRQRGEAGVAAIPVRVREGKQVHAQTLTNGSGLFALELPESLADRPLILEADMPSGWHAVSARANDLPLSPFVWQGDGRWQFTARREYLQDGIVLALIRAPQWQTPAARTVTPGSTQLFLFRYLPQTSGRVRFRYRGEQAIGTNWQHRFLLDPQCNEQSKFVGEDVSRWLPITAGQPICLRVRVDVPADAPQSGRLGLLLEAETDLGDTPLKLKLPALKARIDLQLAR